MPVATISRVGALRRNLRVTQKILARMLGVTERTVIDLEGGREVSEGIRRRIVELERLYRDLSKVVRPQAISHWLTEPNPTFDGEAPADVVAAGKVDLLWQMIFQLRSGVAS